LAEKRKIDLAKTGGGLTVRDVTAMLGSKDRNLRDLATDVFRQLGSNLAPLCAEVGRLLKESTFKVVLTGKIAYRWQIIAGGLKEEANLNYPGLNIEVVPVLLEWAPGENAHFSRISSLWHGSVGACLLGLQEQHVKKMRARCISPLKQDPITHTYSVVVK